MQEGEQGKKYGLQLPSSKLKSAFVGNDDQDDEDRQSSKPVDYYKQSIKRNENSKVQKLQDKALMEDPTAFDYDAVYDDIKQDRRKNAMAKQEEQRDQRPKYIQNLLESAEKKKRETERTKDRLVQREREAEGEQFKDKDVFITSAYKKKLEQRRLEDEQEEKEESKVKDMNSFQRNLYNQSIKNDPPTSNIKKDKEQEIDDKYSKYNDNNNNTYDDKYNDKYSKYDDNNNNSTKTILPEERKGGLTIKKPSNNNNNNQSRNNNNERYQQNNQIKRDYNSKPKEKEKEKEPEVKKYPRRNDAKSIEEARERYFKRKQERTLS